MKQSSKIIGLTGGIATGKSTVVAMLENRGYVVVDSDKIAHDVLDRQDVMAAVAEAFGQEILSNGKIQRNILGELVFESQEKLQMLESIVYPYILSMLEEKTETLAKTNAIVFIDIPLLFEKKDILNLSFDEIWLVYATEEEQIKRMVEDRNMTISEVKSRMNAQISIEKKKEWTNVILWNSGTLGELEDEVIRALDRLGAEI